MDINNIINQRVEERKNQRNKPIEIIQTLDVNYNCNQSYVPIILNPIEIDQLELRRKNIEEEISSSFDKEITYVSYRKINDMVIDGFVDLIRINHDYKTIFITYHTKDYKQADEESFLEEFLSRAMGIYLAEETKDNYFSNPLKELDQMINIIYLIILEKILMTLNL